MIDHTERTGTERDEDVLDPGESKYDLPGVNPEYSTPTGPDKTRPLVSDLLLKGDTIDKWDKQNAVVLFRQSLNLFENLPLPNELADRVIRAVITGYAESSVPQRRNYFAVVKDAIMGTSDTDKAKSASLYNEFVDTVTEELKREYERVQTNTLIRLTSSEFTKQRDAEWKKVELGLREYSEFVKLDGTVSYEPEMKRKNQGLDSPLPKVVSHDDLENARGEFGQAYPNNELLLVVDLLPTIEKSHVEQGPGKATYPGAFLLEANSVSNESAVRSTIRTLKPSQVRVASRSGEQRAIITLDPGNIEYVVARASLRIGLTTRGDSEPSL